MRSAKYTTSLSSDPPNPRLITGTPGKSSLSVFHILIDELPTNTTEPARGGSARSAASKLWMSASHLLGPVADVWETICGAPTRRMAPARAEIGTRIRSSDGMANPKIGLELPVHNSFAAMKLPGRDGSARRDHPGFSTRIH